MARLMLVILFLLFLTRVSEAQLLCTPLSETTYCAGYDAQMQERAITMTPLGNEMTILTEPHPRPIVKPPLLIPIPHRIEPIDTPVRFRAEPFMDDRSRIRDELLPPLPFPE